jgi:hypothetical protein
MSFLVRLFAASSLVWSIGLVPPAWAQESAAPAAGAEPARVRTGSPRLKALMDEASAGSPTFQKLLRSIEATDGIVQVLDGRCAQRTIGCLSWSVTMAGPYRMLFVTIDVGRRDVEVMATIGHELRHALEVLENPALRRPADIAFFYMRDRTVPYERWLETRAAVAAGDAVFRELKQVRAAARLP